MQLICIFGLKYLKVLKARMRRDKIITLLLKNQKTDPRWAIHQAQAMCDYIKSGLPGH